MSEHTDLEAAAAELHAAARRFLQAMSQDRSTDLNFLERVAESFDLSVRVNIAPLRGVTVIARDAHGNVQQDFCRGERVGILPGARLK
jgi:hypothetical protein